MRKLVKRAINGWNKVDIGNSIGEGDYRFDLFNGKSLARVVKMGEENMGRLPFSKRPLFQTVVLHIVCYLPSIPEQNFEVRIFRYVNSSNVFD